MSLKGRLERIVSVRAGCLAVLSVYWWICLDHLGTEWSVNPQYNHGWAIPVLCAYLFWNRWTTLAPASRGSAPGESSWPVMWSILIALLFLPTRLIGEANPEWRLVSWLLALEMVGLSLCAIWLLQGRGAAMHVAFPLAFILISVPWPRPIEGPIIQRLTAISSGISAVILNALGEPALLRGNVIETGTGLVGMDQACSGIRAFQASLMIGLFLGEFYLWRIPWRLWFCAMATGVALALNVCRTTLLVWVASRDGMVAMLKWHDLAGVAILFCCLCAVWALAIALRRSGMKSAPDKVAHASLEGVPSTDGAPPVRLPAVEHPAARTLRTLVLGLAVWLAVVEAGTEAWYRIHENAHAPPVHWTIRWPKDNDTLKDLPLSDTVRAALRFDEGQRMTWIDAEGLRWQVLYLRWLPRRVWVQMISDHSPSICLPASGRKLLLVRQMGPLSTHGIVFQPRTYKFMENGRAVYTFHAVWEDGATSQRPVLDGVTVKDRFKSVRDGRRNPGQRVLELSVWGIEQVECAEAALAKQLEAIVSAPADAGRPPVMPPTSQLPVL